MESMFSYVYLESPYGGPALEKAEVALLRNSYLGNSINRRVSDISSCRGWS